MKDETAMKNNFVGLGFCVADVELVDVLAPSKIDYHHHKTTKKTIAIINSVFTTNIRRTHNPRRKKSIKSNKNLYKYHHTQ